MASDRQTCDILIRNGFVLSMDEKRRIFAPGAVAIRGQEIAEVGTDRDLAQHWQPRRTLDAGGGTVHPGFIDPHVHIVHGTCRGIFANTDGSGGQPVSFGDWKADVRPEDEHVATQLAGLEMLRRGFTCFIEPGTVFDTDAVAEAVESVGVRALLAGTYLWNELEVMGHLGGLDSEALYDRCPASTDRCLEQLGQELRRNARDGLVRGYISVYGMGTASDEVLKAGKALADEHDTVFHQHEGYVPEASAAERARLGKTRIEHMAQRGLLGTNTTLVHMNIVADEDIAPLLESGASIIWCPLLYLRLGLMHRVPCRMPELRRKGVPIAIAIDGALDAAIGDAGALAFLLAGGAGEEITPEAVLEMQTIEPARTAGMADRIGSLETGKRADIVIRSTDAAEAFPTANPVHQLALTTRAGTVDTVLVNGDVVMRNGRSAKLDEAVVLDEARRSVQARMARLGLKPAIAWPVTS